MLRTHKIQNRDAQCIFWHPEPVCQFHKRPSYGTAPQEMLCYVPKWNRLLFQHTLPRKRLPASLSQTLRLHSMHQASSCIPSCHVTSDEPPSLGSSELTRRLALKLPVAGLRPALLCNARGKRSAPFTAAGCYLALAIWDGGPGHLLLGSEWVAASTLLLGDQTAHQGWEQYALISPKPISQALG